MASSGNASGSKPPAKSASTGQKQPGLDDDENRVDFIQRTMIEREASGKRKIKPTFFPETVFVEDSDDPDFDVDEEDSGSGSGGKGSSSSSDSDDTDSDKSDDDGGNSDSDDDDGSGSSSDSDSSKSDSDSDSSDDESDAPKTTLLKTMWAEYDKGGPKIPAKKKRKPKPKAKPPKNELSEEVMASVLSKIRSESGAKSGSVSAAESQVSSNGLPASKTKKQTKTKAKESAKADRKKKSSDGVKKKASTKTAGATTESKKKTKEKKIKKRATLSQLVTDFCTEMGDTRENVDYTMNPLCSICLSHKATYHMNEVIQCDSCGVYCHEECYCLVEEDASGTSSSSTAPWFCDPCKAGNKEVFCELCPNKGGLFKRTDNRLWAHTICAMYTPGAFQGSQKLPADLSGIPNLKWGGKVCSACDDESLARVGIPVKCDAGMCKEHFHITCAQKLGLLSDPYATANEADPFYVSCRAHMPSGIRKRQAEAYKVSQEQLNRKCLRKIDFEPRMQEMLQKHRVNFMKKFRGEEEMIHDQGRGEPISIPVELEPAVHLPSQNKNDTLPSPASVVAPQKKGRFLENSAFAVLTHQKKVQFTEYNVEAELLQEKHEKTVQKVSKMWNVNPGITVAFAAYYADRQRRIAELTKKCTKERRTNTSFSNKEIRLHEELENKVVEQMVLNDETFQIESEYNILRDIIKQLVSPSSVVGPEKPGPSSGRKSKSPSRPAPTAASKKSSPKATTSYYPPVRNATREMNGRFAPKLKKSASKLANSDRLLALYMCSVCKRSEGQHMIIQCDQCRKHFHAYCLDPPLSKLPKIGPTCAWMCSDCHEEEKEVSEEQPPVDVDAPRALRGRTNIKKPVKYTSDRDSDFEELVPASKQLKISPTVKVKEEKESVPEKVKPARKRQAAPKRERKTPARKSDPTPVPVPVVKEENPSPVPKRDGVVPFGVHLTGARMSPVVNLGVNGALSSPPTKPVKRRSTPKKQQTQIDFNELFANFANMHKCRICERHGDEDNLVKCDNCNQNFHFLCLTPPTEYTPKRKGFKWYCMNCDEADDELPISLNK